MRVAPTVSFRQRKPIETRIVGDAAGLSEESVPDHPLAKLAQGLLRGEAAPLWLTTMLEKRAVLPFLLR